MSGAMAASSNTVRLPGLWVVIVGLHLVGAVFAWRLLPHGFDVGHRRFWSNEVLPIVIVVASAAWIAGMWRRRAGLVAAAIAGFATLHVGMAAMWLVVFPVTGKRLALISAVIAIVLCMCLVVSLRGVRWWPAVIGLVIGLVVGILLPWSQRGAAPGTHPDGPVRPFAPRMAPESAALPPWVRMAPEAGAIAIERGRVRIAIDPLLTFVSRSPDRGWTLLADAIDRIGPLRRYVGADGDGYHYAGDEPALLRVSAAYEDLVQLEAVTMLPSAVYSHLNSYCALDVRGHRRLFLQFSAIPGLRIEVTHSEYPIGRPARFAYVDGDGVLHIVKAESGEKGPFTELGRGRLGVTLEVTLFDELQPIATIELVDFASQASTQPSPTAGWGVPENAIEWNLGADRPDAPARLFFTLAGTSVGRGFDSVGHAPGLYRNRMNVHRAR